MTQDNKSYMSPIDGKKIFYDNTSYGIIGQYDAKKVLEDNLRLRASTNQPQKIILLEGPMGCGKTTLIENICKSYCNKYKDRFIYKTVGLLELSGNISNMLKNINEFWNKILKTKKSIILIVDEAEEVFITRKKGTQLRGERTNELIKKLNLNTPNLLIILATNRPDQIDPAVLSRCIERINCDYPTNEELMEIINLHLNFIESEKRNILCKYMCDSSYRYSGRDILNCSIRLKDALQIRKLDNLSVMSRDIPQ